MNASLYVPFYKCNISTLETFFGAFLPDIQQYKLNHPLLIALKLLWMHLSNYYLLLMSGMHREIAILACLKALTTPFCSESEPS
jgi:hypothetical protein